MCCTIDDLYCPRRAEFSFEIEILSNNYVYVPYSADPYGRSGFIMIFLESNNETYQALALTLTLACTQALGLALALALTLTLTLATP